jgi:hypothetical protein
MPAIAFALFMLLPAVPVPQSGRVALEAADCSRIDMFFAEDAVGRAVQHATVPGSIALLDVRPDANGGVKIEAGTGRDYAITACIGAGARTQAQAQQAADAIRLSVADGRVRLENPGAARNWSVHLIIEAPANARMQVETSNGPIGITGVSGRITARSSNGPIGINDVSGTLTARADNGPISVAGGRGDFDVRADNGPIAVSLVGRKWEGRLDVHSQNGPLSVSVPDNYESGVEITSSHSSPWNCGIGACRDGSRDWDDRERTLHLGGNPVIVRVSTRNGPVSVNRR